MMFFRKTLFNREWDRRCFDRFTREKEEIRCVDLKKPKKLGPKNDIREYVGDVGFFTSDTFFVDIPDLTWYVRRDGNIWAEWLVVVPYDSYASDYHCLKKTWVDRRDHPKDDIRFAVPMSKDVKHTVNEFTRERWTLHKLGSHALL